MNDAQMVAKVSEIIILYILERCLRYVILY